jgi:Fe-S cluster assembly ATP-binding protein
MLEIRNLYAAIDGNEILKGINLTIKKGEIHAIMGPNGSGKSTLAKVLAGHPQYEVTAGEVIYEGKNLLELSPDERAREGVFMAFQYPLKCRAFPTRSFCVWPTTRSASISAKKNSTRSNSKIC